MRPRTTDMPASSLWSGDTLVTLTRAESVFGARTAVVPYRGLRIVCAVPHGLIMTNDNYYHVYRLVGKAHVDLFHVTDVGIEWFAAVGIQDIIFRSSKQQQWQYRVAFPEQRRRLNGRYYISQNAERIETIKAPWGFN